MVDLPPCQKYGQLYQTIDYKYEAPLRLPKRRDIFMKPVLGMREDETTLLLLLSFVNGINRLRKIDIRLNISSSLIYHISQAPICSI